MNNTNKGDGSGAMAETSAHVMPIDSDASSVRLAPTPASWSASSDPDEISGLALGSLLCYVKDFGTPYQSTRAGCILDCLLAIDKDPTLLDQGTDSKARKILSSFGGISDQGKAAQVDWQTLRQNLYEIAGDWLWAHGCNNFRHSTAIEANIPQDLREEALRLIKPISMDDDKILNNKDAQKKGYYSFSGHSFHGSEEYYQQGNGLSGVENR